jgi:hypothetical protein
LGRDKRDSPALSALVPAGWNITNAFSISNNGLILAEGSLNGGPTQFIELVPVMPATPAPATWMLVAAGLAVLAFRTRFTRAPNHSAAIHSAPNHSKIN